VEISKANRTFFESSTLQPSVYNMNPLLVLANATIVGLWGLAQVIEIPYVVNCLLMVTCILYSASHASLVLVEEQAIAKAQTEAGEERTVEAPETLRKEDALQFPLIGSLSLFSLYMLFKLFNKDLVNLLISVYFCLIGCAALTVTFAPMFAMLFPDNFKEKTWKFEKKIRHFLPAFIGGESPWEFIIEATVPELVSFFASMVFCSIYFKTKHWALNNVLGICFCLQGIERFSLGTYKIGAILLTGLFFYDIFWVFGTEVMVTVAKSLDGPIKLLFPRSLIPNTDTGKIETSLLGLGDIVIPGFFLALLLRFDAFNANIPTLSQSPPTLNIHTPFPKPYFHSALIAYVAGLGLTMFIMIAFKAAQPALLYLVPACLGSSLLCAFVRGEVTNLFAYSEEQEEPEGEDKKDN